MDGVFLPRVEEFKYLGILFMSEGISERETDKWIGVACAVMWLPESKALSLPVSLPSNTYHGPELWVMTGHLPEKLFWACPNGWRLHGKPRTRWRD